jgi:N-acetylglucosamine kinase-like BadF-type ATPase
LTTAVTVVATDIAIGLDAGGSETLLLAAYEGDSDRMERRGPAANLQREGRDAVAHTLGAMVREALRLHRPVGQLSVCAGVAGAGRSDEQGALQAQVREELVGEADVVHVAVTHDADIALEAAFGAESGVVVIAGTGSMVFGRTRTGTTRRVGGWGHRLGDAGSGYALGRAGLRAVAAAYDGGPDTSLRTHVQVEHGIDGREALVRWVYRDDSALSAVAPLVIEAAAEGDAVADEILTAQTGRLAQQVMWLFGATDDMAPRIALLGGLLRNEDYAQALREALCGRGADGAIDILRTPPVVGALRRAHRRLE